MPNRRKKERERQAWSIRRRVSHQETKEEEEEDKGAKTLVVFSVLHKYKQEK